MIIGFVGLGNMGAPMASNLVVAGHTVHGFDVVCAPPDGVVRSASLADIATHCSTIITMLPNGAILREVVDQLLPLLKPGSLVVDCSTVDVESARAVAVQLEAAGHMALDAPVSGGTAGATAGTLTFMVGGSAPAFQRAQPLLNVMGARSLHCGESGTGQAAKICNNMILGVTMHATCEAFALADGLGLSRQALYDVVSSSSGQSWSMTTYCPAPGVGPQSPADNDYQPGFSADLMLKDLSLGQKAADASGTHTALGKHARALYEAYVNQGHGARDFSAVLETLRPPKS